jgi:hypothetical protein
MIAMRWLIMEKKNIFGIIAGVFVIMLAVFGLNYMGSQRQVNTVKSLDFQAADNIIASQSPVAQFNATDNISTQAIAVNGTNPIIVQVTPANNQSDIKTHADVVVRFSEPMDAKTINNATFIVQQRTTPVAGSASMEYRTMQVEGTIVYDGLTATFTPIESVSFNPLQPSMQFGNVFTVTVTTGAKDLAGNPLAENYIWSFTTGGDAFNTDATTSQTG